MKVLDLAPQLSAFESVNTLGPPELGEHTLALLTELGYSAAERAALLESGAAEASPPADDRSGARAAG